MEKRVPKHIRQKIKRMNELMQRIVDLNTEVEEWCERNGAKDGYDLSTGYRDERGYGILCLYPYLEAIEEAIKR